MLCWRGGGQDSGHNYFLIITFWTLFIRYWTVRRRDIVHDIAENQPDSDRFIGSGNLRHNITLIIVLS